MNDYTFYLFFNDLVLFHVSLDGIKRFHVVLFNAKLFDKDLIRNTVNVCVRILNGFMFNFDYDIDCNAKHKCGNYKINTDLNGAVDDSVENGFNICKELFICNK